MSGEEFAGENYGGALYLATQAKDHIDISRMQSAGQHEVEPLPGEISFALPLPLQVTRTSNLREGPGLEFEVVAVLEPDTPLIGYSYKGQWVRIKSEDLTNGWIFQALVTGR